MSQFVLLAAVQAHPVGIVTPTLPVVAPAPADPLVGDSVASHAAPACVRVNVCPAIVSVALREEAVVFAATL